jgi:hypothetical protein
LAFKKFVVEYGFATLVQYSMFCFLSFYLPIDSIAFNTCNFFSMKVMKERRCISQPVRNRTWMKQNFSLDGSDEGCGGQPASSITISGAIHPGTSANKSNVASTLMCGSNAAGEALPLHIMFSSKAEDEKNYLVNIEWCLAYHVFLLSLVPLNRAFQPQLQ